MSWSFEHLIGQTVRLRQGSQDLCDGVIAPHKNGLAVRVGIRDLFLIRPHRLQPTSDGYEHSDVYPDEHCVVANVMTQFVITPPQSVYQRFRSSIEHLFTQTINRGSMN